MVEDEKKNIIKLSDVREQKKSLDEDKIFRFECDVHDDQIRLGLREINVYTPYYYEIFFTLEQLKKKNRAFEGCKDLEEAKGHFLILFNKENTFLKSLDDGEKIEICLKIYYIAVEVDESFILERKIINEKDEALNDLFDIQKFNIQLLEDIKKICQDEKYKNVKVAKNIFNLLMN